MRTPRFLGGTTMWEKTTAIVISVFIFYYKEKHLTILYWCRLIPIRRHPPAEGCNLLSFSSTHWKGAPTP